MRILEPGVKLYEEEWLHDTYHWVSIDLSQKNIGSVPACPTFPMSAVPPIGHGIASVGPDFKVDDQPGHLYVRNREIWTTGAAVGASFVYSHGDAKAMIDRTHWSVDLVKADETTIPIQGINILPWDIDDDEPGVQAYTPRARPRHGPIVGDGIYRFTLTNPTGWKPTEKGWVRRYTVKESDDRSEMLHRTKAGEIGLESPLPIPLTPGNRISWAQNINDFHGATDVISGMSIVVKDGVNVAVDQHGGSGDMARDGYYYDPCPRTVLALSEDGRTAYFLAVDGKPSNGAGVRFPRLGDFCIQRLGAHDAFNLDGGGSTVLWTERYGVVSKPSEGYVRSLIYSTIVW